MTYVCNLRMGRNPYYQYDRYWNTGEPTEEGNYILLVDSEIKCVLAEWDGDAFDIDSEYHDEPIIAWHKIPDYEEQK